MVKTLRIAFVQWPEGLLTDHPNWPELKSSISSAHPDILITNELPFGPWIAESAVFCEDDARLSIQAHERGLEGLIELNVPAIISSRPVWSAKRLVNEAFVLENGSVRPLHRKHYFPNEPGWFEGEWYAGDDSGFRVAEVLGIRIGVLLCTDAMFNERARAYGRQKASLIVIPRASGLDLDRAKEDLKSRWFSSTRKPRYFDSYCGTTVDASRFGSKSPRKIPPLRLLTYTE